MWIVQEYSFVSKKGITFVLLHSIYIIYAAIVTPLQIHEFHK